MGFRIITVIPFPKTATSILTLSLSVPMSISQPVMTSNSVPLSRPSRQNPTLSSSTRPTLVLSRVYNHRESPCSLIYSKYTNPRKVKVRFLLCSVIEEAMKLMPEQGSPYIKLATSILIIFVVANSALKVFHLLYCIVDII